MIPTTTFYDSFNRCPNCNAVMPYHNAPCTGLPFYQPMPLDEEAVRRIIREELDRRFDSTGVPR